jgi:hypothetical protein
VFVIAEDVFSASGVEIGQCAASIPDSQQFRRQPSSRFITLNPLKPFFGSPSNGGCDAFSGDGGKLADNLLSAGIFDVQRHWGTLAEIFLP